MAASITDRTETYRDHLGHVRVRIKDARAGTPPLKSLKLLNQGGATGSAAKPDGLPRLSCE
jgi:hypothetical protein